MKKVSLRSVKGKSRIYLKAIYKFFKGIPEISFIENVYFVRSTNSRVYFYVDNIAHNCYGYNYAANIFVRKKDLSVEFCTSTGEITTQDCLDKFKMVNRDNDEE